MTMPGFGALRNLAQSTAAQGGKRIKTMTIHMPEEGKRAETSVEHEHQPPHPAEQFRFAQNENEALAAHLSKHLGVKLPGKATAAGDSAESEVSKENFE
jgi:hypothetical protein